MKYEKPEVNMFKFDVEDVITTSMPTIPSTPESSTTNYTRDFVHEEL